MRTSGIQFQSALTVRTKQTVRLAYGLRRMHQIAQLYEALSETKPLLVSVAQNVHSMEVKVGVEA